MQDREPMWEDQVIEDWIFFTGLCGEGQMGDHMHDFSCVLLLIQNIYLLHISFA